MQVASGTTEPRARLQATGQVATAVHTTRIASHKAPMAHKARHAKRSERAAPTSFSTLWDDGGSYGDHSAMKISSRLDELEACKEVAVLVDLRQSLRPPPSINQSMPGKRDKVMAFS